MLEDSTIEVASDKYAIIDEKDKEMLKAAGARVKDVSTYTDV